MKIAIGSDHQGYKYKVKIIEKFKKEFDFVDVGSHNELRTDYPVYAFEVGELVASEECNIGILVCKSGIGMSIACNKVKNIRCARVLNDEDAYFSRAHNDANVIALSSESSIKDIYSMIETFIHTKLLPEKRYQKRCDMITEYEKDIK